MSNKLPNYLRTFRKRSGLSQADVAFLLGSAYGTKISRYERRKRIPTLKTVIALELIYEAHSKDLFEGLYLEIAHHIKQQAILLEKELRKEEKTPPKLQKLRCLEKLIHTLEDRTASAREDS